MSIKLILVGLAALIIPSSLAQADPQFRVLYAFSGGRDGGAPQAGLIGDTFGNLYGTTDEGGRSCHHRGCGTVFKIAPDGSESVLYAFTGQGDGGTFTVLHAFDGQDGFGTIASLTADKAGNLYGTAFKGGATFNGGAVYKLSPDGTETVLYNFTGGADGQFPNSQLIFDKDGNLYGTTVEGGAFGQGTVYRLTPDGTESVLYSFSGGSDGGLPVGGVLLKRGRLYGATSQGGSDPTACGNIGCGTVYEIKL